MPSDRHPDLICSFFLSRKGTAINHFALSDVFGDPFFHLGTRRPYAEEEEDEGREYATALKVARRTVPKQQPQQAQPSLRRPQQQ